MMLVSIIFRQLPWSLRFFVLIMIPIIWMVSTSLVIYKNKNYKTEHNLINYFIFTYVMKILIWFGAKTKLLANGDRPKMK